MPALARKMTSIVAGSIPNPNSARELPNLMRQAGLRDIKIETWALTTPHEFLSRVMCGALFKAAEKGVVSRTEVEDWLGEQARLHASGDFFQVWLFVLATGTVVR
jgi:hypothetical protein